MLIREEFRNDNLKVIREGEKKPGRFEMDESLVAQYLRLLFRCSGGRRANA